MKILAQYDDGSRTVLYEAGDRVRVKKDQRCSFGFGKKGDLATVIRRDRPRVEGQPSSIDFLDIQTDQMKDHQYGTLHVAPWDLESADLAPTKEVRQ